METTSTFRTIDNFAPCPFPLSLSLPSSSASIYPACLAPYVMVTACTDNKIRFWRVRASAAAVGEFEWCEWRMESASGVSEIEVPGTPVSVSAAYSGRIACAYQTGQSFQRPGVDPSLRYVNLCVGIYECESTGGAEWILEDTISLKNIEIQANVPAMDMTIYEDGSQANRRQESVNKVALHFADDVDGEDVKRNLKGR